MVFSFQITSFFALVMRLVDLLAIGTEFEISQGFHTAWRSHQWRGKNHECGLYKIACLNLNDF